FHDYLKKVPQQAISKRTVESLIKAGAFDELGASRRALLQIHEGAVEQAAKEKKDAEHGNLGFDFDELFAEAGGEDVGDSRVPDLPEWSKRDKLAFEREMLGLYV